MSDAKNERWLDQTLPHYKRLTDSVVAIVENLLKARKIDYLAVSGRTKAQKSALEKISRKGYRSPAEQLTDLSGIRIIVFFESAVAEVSQLIDEAFFVLNQDDLLSADQIGYRSVHYVCDLGPDRASLPEFEELAGLKFEFQVRTVLQHAWAELAHDRKYKFSGKLPKSVERQLYLYAGMLEIADQGFDEVSRKIDSYIENIELRSSQGDLEVDIDSISLESFFNDWAQRNQVALGEPKSTLEDLIDELHAFGINTLSDLEAIIPERYAEVFKKEEHDSSIFGVVRDWMLIHDWRRFAREVQYDWIMVGDDLFEHFFEHEELREFFATFGYREEDDHE